MKAFADNKINVTPLPEDKILDWSRLKAFADNKINVTPLPEDKILDWSRLKAFTDNKINVTPKQKFFLGWVENIVGKGENDGYQHFLLFPQCFQKAPLFKVVKSRDCVVKG